MLKNNKKGFIHIIVLLIVVLTIAQLFGFGPIELWTKVIAPILLFIWNMILIVSNFLANLIKSIF